MLPCVDTLIAMCLYDSRLVQELVGELTCIIGFLKVITGLEAVHDNVSCVPETTEVNNAIATKQEHIIVIEIKL